MFVRTKMTHKKAAKIGFWVGFIGTFVSTLGLAIRFIEIISVPFLFISRLILGPFEDTFADLPGIINILVFAGVNGIVWGLIIWAISYLVPQNSKSQASQNYLL